MRLQQADNQHSSAAKRSDAFLKQVDNQQSLAANVRSRLPLAIIKYSTGKLMSRAPLAFIPILPGIHANHTEKCAVPLVMYGG